MYEDDQIKSDFLKQPKTNPFRTPDKYFESIEDRIMGSIQKQPKKEKTTLFRVVRILKPALGVAASLSLVYMLAYNPINSFLLKNAPKTEVVENTSNDMLDNYSLNLASIDENSLVTAIFSEETSNSETNPDEVLAYLSSGLNEVEIYSEIQN